MEHRTVVVTGIGIVSALGSDREMTWRNLRDGCSGVRRLTLQSSFVPLHCLGAPAAIRNNPIPQMAELACSGEIAGRSPHRHSAVHLNHQDRDRWRLEQNPEEETELPSRMALKAAHEALEHAGLAEQCLPQAENRRFGCAVSSSKGNLSSLSEVWHQYQAAGEVSAQNWIEFFPGTLASQLAGHFGIHGPVSCPIAACATGIHSVIRGAQWIIDNTCDVALVGSVDSSLTPLVIGSYQRMGVLAPDDGRSPESAIRPFSADRRGFAVGEGAAVLVLEEANHARRRGAFIHAELAGWTIASDACSMTGLRDGAETLIHCLRETLKRAELTPEDIGHVNCHGTATIANDRWEAAALSAVFGNPITQPLYTANKSLIGHLLGASGGVELAIMLLSLRDQFVPPTRNLDFPDDQCPLPFVEKGQAKEFNAALKVCAGFGGHVATLAARLPCQRN